jgi:MFS family permease
LSRSAITGGISHKEDTTSHAQHTHAPAQLDPRRWWALALLCGAFFMVILDASIVIVALPSIEADLGFSEQGLEWVMSAYAFTFAGLLLLGGRAAPKPLRLVNSQAPSAGATGAPRRAVCGAASR